MRVTTRHKQRIANTFKILVALRERKEKKRTTSNSFSPQRRVGIVTENFEMGSIEYLSYDEAVDAFLVAINHHPIVILMRYAGVIAEYCWEGLDV